MSRTALLLSLALVPGVAQANDSGKIGKSTSGCGTCHGSSADGDVTVTLSTSASSIAPGDTVTVDVEISSSDSNHGAAGFNVSASSGSLASGSGSRLDSGELTHSGSKSFSGGSATFSFSWTAPSSDGSYTLYASGNAVNQDRGTTGDGWNLGELILSVTSPVDTEDTGESDADDVDTDVPPDDTDAPSDDTDAPADDTGAPADDTDDTDAPSDDTEETDSDTATDTKDKDSESGCSSTGGMGALWLVVAGAGALRRRRTSEG